jgi:hypothetical protein
VKANSSILLTFFLPDKEYILEDVDKWSKEMIEANGGPRPAKRRKK